MTYDNKLGVINVMSYYNMNYDIYSRASRVQKG